MKNRTIKDKRVTEIRISPSYAFADRERILPGGAIRIYELSPERLSPTEELSKRIFYFGVKGGNC